MVDQPASPDWPMLSQINHKPFSDRQVILPSVMEVLLSGIVHSFSNDQLPKVDRAIGVLIAVWQTFLVFPLSDWFILKHGFLRRSRHRSIHRLDETVVLRIV